MKQRALADAGGADDGHHFAGGDFKIQIAQHGERSSADRVALDDAVGF